MTNPTGRPLALILLDGWGVSSNTDGNAIALAHTPYYDEITSNFPRTVLSTSLGNCPADAETGHLNIGAGRIAETDVSMLEQALRSGEFAHNTVLKGAMERAAASGSTVHLAGLVSAAGSDSFPESIYSLLRMAKKSGVKDVCVHAILDGRDVPQRTADVYVEALEIKMADIGVGRIASLCGRFFAMDEEGNLERTARAYTMIAHGEGERATDAADAIRGSFLRGISDEFIAPIIIESEDGTPAGQLKDGDLLIFFNHRGEGMRQLVKFLAARGEIGGSGSKPKFDAVCLTGYDREMGFPAAFEAGMLNNCLVGILNDNGIRNFRITDERRSVHLSRMFNCGVEGNSDGDVILAASDPDSIESEPEMRSFKIADKFIRSLESNPADAVLVVNFPAGAELAETGNIEKTIEAIQYLDTCLGGVLEKIRDANGVAIITSSHGGCEKMTNKNSDSVVNSVPLHIFDPSGGDANLQSGGSLIDIAPTMLGILGIPVPPEMTGRDLRL